jgi:hypothetical protein
METSDTHFISRIAENLKKAATALEEFQVQFALGKAEASDKYEEVKNELYDFIEDSKAGIREEKDVIKQKLESLQQLLNTGKAFTMEAFNTQKANILNAVKQLESLLEQGEITAELYSKFTIELRRFMIKLDILSLHFELSRVNSKEEFVKKKKEFINKVDELKKKIEAGGAEFEKRKDELIAGINESFVHLRKAFTGK